MENPPKLPPSTDVGVTHLGDDLLHNILSKLPAQSFGSAACVNRSWNVICSRILSRPKLTSAISLNPLLPEAMSEVLGKVLSGPVRPHFVILCICPKFDLDEAHRLITERLSCSIPIVTSCAAGIIGRDALTDQFREVNVPCFDEEDIVEPPNFGGISLTVGYVPGLKVDCIPLLPHEEGPGIDKFVMDIKDYSASRSGCMSPEAIVMFGDLEADMKPVLEKLDYAMSKQTIIAGNESCCFRCGSIGKLGTTSICSGQSVSSYKAVALVFARDKNNLDAGPGKIEFYFSVGAGVTAIGPTYKVVSAKLRNKASATWLTAKRHGENETFDGQQMLDDIDMEVLESDLYIGVTKRRKCSVRSEKVKSLTSVVYHPVQNADEEYLYVGGGDIRTGDPFRFYVPDPTFALSSSMYVSENFRDLQHKDIIGGFIFACCGRGSTFFEEPNVDSSPLLDNFPNTPVTGMFCGGEVGRGPWSDESQEHGTQHSSLHVYSSVYLLMSYSLPPCKTQNDNVQHCLHATSHCRS